MNAPEGWQLQRPRSVLASASLTVSQAIRNSRKDDRNSQRLDIQLHQRYTGPVYPHRHPFCFTWYGYENLYHLYE
jgi:hypothetical protein